MARTRIAVIPAALAALCATVAFAMTESQLLSQAEQVQDRYDALKAAVLGCPDGQCANAAALVDAYHAREDERAWLHDERDAMSGCSCVTVDATLGRIDRTAFDTQAEIADWDIFQ